MADFGRSAVPLDMQLYLLSDGTGRWIAEIEIPATGWRDAITLTDYPDEKEAEGIAAWVAEQRWRKGTSDRRTQLTVNRVYVEPAREEA